MPAKKIQTTGKADDHRTADYLQIFLYRVPKANRGAFATVQGKLAELFHRHVMVRSDFFVLRDAPIFAGFRDFRSVLGATRTRRSGSRSKRIATRRTACWSSAISERIPRPTRCLLK